MAETTPAERRRVMAELRAFAHPVRLRIYELLVEKPRTTMQVAGILGEPPTRLYHHVNVLQKAGLLRLAETRPIRGTVEKYFEAVRPSGAAAFEKTPEALQSARAAANAVLEQARHDVLEGIAAVRGNDPIGPVLLRLLIGTTPARAARVHRRIRAFLKSIRKEYGSRGKPGKQAMRWSLTIAFAPSPRQRP